MSSLGKRLAALTFSVVLACAVIVGGPVSPALATGDSWTPHEAAEANDWSSVAYGDGVWIAVAQSGANRVMRSTDGGVNWTAHAAARASPWRSVAYGDGVWVAVAFDGEDRVMRSTDKGITWSDVGVTGVPIEVRHRWSTVAYGDDVWVAVAANKNDALTDLVMRSADKGLTWTTTGITGVEANEWISVAHGDDVWVAVANVGGNSRVMRSVNKGLTWAPISPAVDANNWLSVAHGNGVWVAVATDGANRVMRSIDKGLTWTTTGITGVEASTWRSVAFGDGVWVAIAQSEPNRVMRSVDKGLTWTTTGITGVEANPWRSVAYGDGVWVSVASDGANRVMRSFSRSSSSSAAVETSVSNPAIHLDLQAGIGQQGPNAPVLMEGEGLLPGSAYSLTLREPSRVIQSGSANTGGRFSHVVNLPSDLKPGSYSITLSAIGTSGESLVLIQSFRISGDGSFEHIGPVVPTVDGGLAKTGPDSSVVLGGFALAVLVTLLGVALAVTSRRRAQSL